jgi:hypothetical protein
MIESPKSATKINFANGPACDIKSITPYPGNAKLKAVGVDSIQLNMKKDISGVSPL